MKLPAALLLLCHFACFFAKAQINNAVTGTLVKQSPLFTGKSPLNITLSGDMRSLLNDRGDDAVFHPVKLKYEVQPGLSDSGMVQIKTRGHFRRQKQNCTYPPLLINFSKSDTGSKLFGNGEKLKLVMPCRSDDFVVKEWLVYQLYNLLTPLSLKARLVRLIIIDNRRNKPSTPMFAILLEPDKAMAKRNGLTISKAAADPARTDNGSFLTMAMFQYLIGNTDWSVQYQQNIVLLKNDSLDKPLCVAYDFDHAGIVNAPYANPAEELQMSGVTERRYRGYCITDISVYTPYVVKFNALKNDIYALYKNCEYIDERYKKFVVKFLDEFYNTINNPGAFAKDFLYPCDKNGTGNVIIKGLKKQQ